MKASRFMLPAILACLSLFCIGCSHTDKSQIRSVVKSELDLLKHMDSSDAKRYASYSALFPEEGWGDAKEELEEAVQLFFRNFDYRIEDITINSRAHTAKVKIRLKTLDARALAVDYAKTRLSWDMLQTAKDPSRPEGSMLSIKERYQLLLELLKGNMYSTKDSVYTMGLVKDSSKKWTIKRSPALENALVGGLQTYLSDSHLLTPEETVTVVFDTLQGMDEDEMCNYLGIGSLPEDSTGQEAEIAHALARQMHQTFDYEITQSQTNGYRATVTTRITTFDSDKILSLYQEELEKYLATPQAVTDGAQDRTEKSYNLLLSCITQNQATIETSVVLNLINDGACWNLENAGTELGEGIFGQLANSPVVE